MFVKPQEINKLHIDCHGHLAFIPEKDLAKALERIDNSLVYIQGGYNFNDQKLQIESLRNIPLKVIPCFGLHPWACKGLSGDEIDSELEAIKMQVVTKNIQYFLIGETGLDKLNGHKDKDIQERIFRKHLEWARDLTRPVVLHIVQQHGRAIEIIEDYRDLVGWVHGFSGTIEVARAYRRQGFLLSVGPNILLEHFKNLRQTVAEIELECLALESDWPEGPGELNEQYKQTSILEVAAEIAQLKGIETEQVLQACQQNVFNLLEKGSH